MSLPFTALPTAHHHLFTILFRVSWEVLYLYLLLFIYKALLRSHWTTILCVFLYPSP